MEYGNFGGPDYGGEYVLREPGEPDYNPDATDFDSKYRWEQKNGEPINDLDAIYETHDKAYSYTEKRLENHEITQEQANLEMVEADAKLIRDSLAYNPFLDESCTNKAYAEIYKTYAIALFAEKLIAWDMLGAPLSQEIVDLLESIGSVINSIFGPPAGPNGGPGGSNWGGGWGGISPDVGSDFSSGQNFVVRADPLTLDLDGDGIVNNLDANWNNLNIWRDINSDGLSQSEELFTLEALGITGLATKATNYTYTYTKSDGTTGVMADVHSAVDTFHQQFTEAIPVSPDVEALPDMQGACNIIQFRKVARCKHRSKSAQNLQNENLRRAA
jgi:hypothetical protein